MQPKIRTNADESPTINVLIEPLTWDEIDTYVRISKCSLLAEVPDSGGQFRGFYCLGSGLGHTPDLGTDEEVAVRAFRDHLRQSA